MDRLRDQILGGVFFLSALGIMVAFIVLMSRFFRGDALPDHPLLKLSLRYAAGAAMMAFGVGIVMSSVSGRGWGEGGNFMPVHAAGFHALQAIPLVALLLGAGAAAVSARTAIHAAGIGWLLLSAGMVIQAFSGVAPTTSAPGLWLSVAGAAVWVAAAGSATVGRLRPAAARVGA
jgi:hypothetical protein